MKMWNAVVSTVDSLFGDIRFETRMTQASNCEKFDRDLYPLCNEDGNTSYVLTAVSLGQMSILDPMKFVSVVHTVWQADRTERRSSLFVPITS